MNELLKNAPAIIEAAAKSLLGTLALMVLLLGVLAFTYFRTASERARLSIYILLFSGVAAFGVAVIRATQAAPECYSEFLKSQLLGSDRAGVIIRAGQTIREQFRTQRFDCVASVATVLLQVDEYNGHGLYFTGEVWRVKARQDPAHSDFSRERMREHFFRYLAHEPRLPSNERDGKAEDCYKREKGYCGERTAWINHIMATDYYQQAQDEVDNNTKVQRLRRALEFANAALRYGEFDQMMATTDLKRKVQEKLRDLGAP